MNIAGHKISNWWLLGGGLGAVAAVYFYRKAASGPASPASSASSSSIDPVTGLPYSQDNQADPVTGLTYLQEAQEYGSVQAAEQEVTSGSAYYGVTGAGSAIDSGYPTIYGAAGTTSPSPGSYATDAQWAQAVTAGLADLGYNSADVSTALGLYFQNQPLGTLADGASALSIVQAAIAEYGQPPVGTYQITAAPTSAGSTTGNAGSGTGAAAAAKPASAPQDLQVIPVSNTAITAEWRPVAGASGYEFQVTPKDPAPHNIGARTSYNAGGLKPRTSYVVHVAAVNAAGTGPYATHSFTTK